MTSTFSTTTLLPTPPIKQAQLYINANTLKKTTMELGGKSANIVFADADWESAIANALFGIFYNKDVSVPFGGYEASGFGRENGKEVMENYTQTKSIWIDLS